MKVNLNKQTYTAMDPQVAGVVKAWSTKYHKRSIRVEIKNTVYVREDARYTAINLVTKTKASGQAAGEWSGLGDFMCNQELKIPQDCVIIMTEFFCGTPFLTVYQPPQKPLSTALLEQPMMKS